MGKKAKRWRQQRARLTRSHDVCMNLMRKADDQLAREIDKNARLRDKVAELEGKLRQQEPLNCFRHSIAKLPFGRMGRGDILGINVQIDPLMVRYGFMQERGIYSLSGQVFQICQNLARQIENELVKQLADMKDPYARVG